MIRRVTIHAVTMIAFVVAAWLCFAMILTGWPLARNDVSPWCFNPSVECMR